jgi:phosphate uptake regulator
MAEEELLTDEELDAQYRSLIDSFIDQANQQSQSSSIENVSMALLHAASRFNAYVVSSHAENLADYEKELDRARAFFMSKYDEMLSENLEDYKKVYQQDMKYIHLMK